MAIDLVEPYITINSINGLVIDDDIVPLSKAIPRSYQLSKFISIPKGTDVVFIEQNVGSAFIVDSTSVMYAKWDDLLDIFDEVFQLSV